MNLRSRVFVFLALALCAGMAFAQGTTTGALGGVITDADNAALPGVNVEAVHQPTGTRYTTITDTQGRFNIQNVRVGGPYLVSVSLEGFHPQQTTDVHVNLGEETRLTFKLNLETVTETVTVVGESNPLISPSRTGAASNVTTETIESLPTLDRSFNDFARTNPLVVITAEGEDPDAISFAGRNTRYNNIQIDGAVNNDLFGLADSGTPGGQANTTPISLDAIQEIQLVMADYDVRNGGFSGGSLNAITRSGSNSHHGSVYYFGRDDSLVGDGPEELGEPGKFEQQQYGFRIGGPIIQDKIFYFANLDFKTEDLPTGWSLNGTTGQCFNDCSPGVQAAATLFENKLAEYGFDPGSRDENVSEIPSDKAFVRFDFNIAEAHQLTARWNYVDAARLVNRPNSFVYEWPSEAYDFSSETNSLVGQLNSVFGSDMFNEFRLTYQTVRDRRPPVSVFPWIEIENDSRNGFVGEFEAGSEPFSTRNALDQDIIEFTDDFTWILGNHTLTFGTSNQFFEFDNLFIQNAFGSYEFDTLDDFVNDRPAREWEYTVVNPGQPETQQFGVNQWGFYAGDVWAAKPNLTLTYGLRVDVPFFPDEPSFNPEALAIYGVDTSEMPSGEQLWQPRIGANWDINGDGKQQLRGGIGIFAGRTPYVWISNQYARTGVEQTFYRLFDIPFNPDPFGQVVPPDASGSAGEFNFIDPSFKMPSLWRINLAYDRELPWWNLVGSAEFLYSQAVDDINFRNVNIRRTGETLGFDGRPLFETVDSDFSGAYQITNTGDGDATNFAVKLERPYRGGVWGYVSYAYGESNVVNDGTSSRAVSNFQFNEALDPNDPPLSRSDFSVEHRFNASVSYRFNGDSRWPTTVSGFYNLQSGRPYMYIYDFFFPSINNDTYGSNDLVYVPANPEDVEFSRGTWEQWNAWVEGEDCLRNARGGILERNACDSPWFHSFDVRVAQDLPIKQTHLQLTFDLFNLMNLFDEDSGVVRYVPFGTIQEIEYEGTNAEGKPIYSLPSLITDPEDNEKFEINNQKSRWRAQFGIRWTF